MVHSSSMSAPFGTTSNGNYLELGSSALEQPLDKEQNRTFSSDVYSASVDMPDLKA